MTYTRKNKGVCSYATKVTLNDDSTIESIEVMDGCDGNLKGICMLLVGMPADKAIQRLKGLTCEGKPTSCPDQISVCLEEALQQMNGAAAAS